MRVSKAAEMRGRGSRQLAAAAKVVCDKEKLQSRISSPPLSPPPTPHPPTSQLGAGAPPQQLITKGRGYLETLWPDV